MRTIVTPLDGSELAERALPYTRLLAGLLRAPALLLRAVTEDEQLGVVSRLAAEAGAVKLSAPNWDYERRALEELTRRAEDYLRAPADELRRGGVTVATATPAGDPAECIAATARHRDALVVMATHGYSGLRRWTLGSTADRVVHAAQSPVLLVRAGVAPPEPPVLRRILVPLDGSALAEQALPVALEVAAASGAEVVLLQALLPLTELAPALAPMGRPMPMPPELIDEELEIVRDHLKVVGARVARPDVTLTYAAVLGYPAEVILQEAAGRHADLIVMATHGRSGLRRWVLGSVADKVLHAAHTPLLLVRASDGAPHAEGGA